MIGLQYVILARMASQAYQEAYIDRGTKEAYILPEELLDMLIGELRRCILYTDDPLKERILNLYIYCNISIIREMGWFVRVPHAQTTPFPPFFKMLLFIVKRKLTNVRMDIATDPNRGRISARQ